MSRNGSGVYSLPSGNPVVTGTTISSTWANNTLNDIASALTGSIASDGQTTPSANLPMGTYAHTGVGNATARTMYASAAQVEDGTLNYLTSVSGTNAITATAPVSMSAYVAGQTFRFIAAGANTGAVTLNLNAIGAKSVTRDGTTALVANDIVSGGVYQIVYDGTQFQLTNSSNASVQVSSFSAGTTGFTPNTATTGAITLGGTLNVANGGTGLTSLTAGYIPYGNGTSAFSSSSGLFFDGTNLGVGTSSPSNKLTIVGVDAASGGIARIAGTNYGLTFNSDTGAGFRIEATDPTGLSSYQPLITNGSIQQFKTGGTERMRIDSSGNVGIGISSPSSYNAAGRNLVVGTTSNVDSGITIASGTTATSYLLFAKGTTGSDAYNGYIGYKQDSNYMQFNVNGGVERMRIDSSGNVSVGDTSNPGSRVYSKGSTSADGAYTYFGYNSSGTTLFFVRNDGVVSTGSAANSPYNLTTASAANMYVASSGTLFRSTSSIKYKTDVQDAVHGLDDVMKLRPVTYKGKTDGDTVFGGLIAEEVHEAGLTEFVQYAEDGSPDALAYGQMVSLAFKAIQEQQELIKQLQADVAALQAK